jgi:hypothetical protein
MSERKLAQRVAEILPPLPDQPACLDFVGNEIDCVYAYNPPLYAVYRTRARVMVQFADREVEGGQKAREQRQALLPLTALRGQVNALIDGWHSAGDLPDPGDRTLAWRICRFLSLAWLPCRDRWNAEIRKRAVRYDRRMADAIVTALEEHTATMTAQALLQEIKNDIISERTSIARIKYLLTAFAVAAGSILLILILASDQVGLRPPRDPIWIAVGGGTVGAFFSIAIGLRGRTILIDLQNRDNIADAVLRVLIGAMSGGILLCLLLSRLVEISGLKMENGAAPAPERDLVVFVLGFFAGFFERLVPNLLERTNLGTQSDANMPSPSSPSGDPGRPVPTTDRPDGATARPPASDGREPAAANPGRHPKGRQGGEEQAADEAPPGRPGEGGPRRPMAPNEDVPAKIDPVSENEEPEGPA